MKFISKNGLRYLSFDIFPGGLFQAIFSRSGGTSPSPWGSLNVGGSVGDDNDRVRENRYRSFAALGRSRTSMYDVWQVHSSDIVIANTPHKNPNTYSPLKADGMITGNPEVSLFMRFADCTPVLLYDPKKNVAGIAHAGWQGTVKKVCGNIVQSMKAVFGCSPADIMAAIGPAIGPDHYEVGQSVIDQVRYSFGSDSEKLLISNGFRTHFDLWSANQLVLQQAGVEQIEIAGLCTACHVDDWYSHRAQNGKTGRFGALIALPES
ncbi:MAG: peptidoglycan editing factor PgeF [Chloroflexota bacterium]